MMINYPLRGPAKNPCRTKSWSQLHFTPHMLLPSRPLGTEGQLDGCLGGQHRGRSTDSAAAI